MRLTLDAKTSMLVEVSQYPSLEGEVGDWNWVVVGVGWSLIEAGMWVRRMFSNEVEKVGVGWSLMKEEVGVEWPLRIV